MKIAPSILASDLADFATGLKQCEEGKAELIHVDVMDGHFVPNLSFGPPVVEAIRARTELPLDVHLMVSNPERLLDEYLKVADWVSIHWEAAIHLDGLVQQIRDQGKRAGVALNPATPVDVLDCILPSLDFVLLMSINPGFCGQTLLPYTLDKSRRLRAKLEERGLDVDIEMDGGIKDHNLAEVAAAGVDVAVIGSGIFGRPEPVAALQKLRDQAREREKELQHS